MPHEHLENLVKARQLKAEPSSEKEIAGLISSGLARLRDAGNETLSIESRFDLAYNAAHALSLAALRRAGYRSESRYKMTCYSPPYARHSSVLRWFRPFSTVLSQSTGYCVLRCDRSVADPRFLYFFLITDAVSPSCAASTARGTASMARRPASRRDTHDSPSARPRPWRRSCSRRMRRPRERHDRGRLRRQKALYATQKAICVI